MWFWTSRAVVETRMENSKEESHANHFLLRIKVSKWPRPPKGRPNRRWSKMMQTTWMAGSKNKKYNQNRFSRRPTGQFAREMKLSPKSNKLLRKQPWIFTFIIQVMVQLIQATGSLTLAQMEDASSHWQTYLERSMNIFKEQKFAFLLILATARIGTTTSMDLRRAVLSSMSICCSQPTPKRMLSHGRRKRMPWT